MKIFRSYSDRKEPDPQCHMVRLSSHSSVAKLKCTVVRKEEQQDKHLKAEAAMEFLVCFRWIRIFRLSSLLTIAYTPRAARRGGHDYKKATEITTTKPTDKFRHCPLAHKLLLHG
jgi:hypothetical protein